MISRLTAPLAVAGAWAVELLDYAGHLGILFVRSLGGCVAKPLRPQAIFYEVWKIGIQSWLIVAVASLFIGMVLAFQSAYQMQRLAAEIYIASLV